MSVTFACPHCDMTLSADDSRVGQEFSCPRCRAGLTVPEPQHSLPDEATPGDQTSGPNGMGRRGNKLLIEIGWGEELPSGCIKCNGLEHRRYKHTLRWHHPALYVLLLAGILIYVIVAICVRKTVIVMVPLCRKHWNRRRTMILSIWLGFAGSIGLFALAIATENGIPALVATLMLLVVLVLGSIVSNLIRPVEIDDRDATISGVGRDYLKRFPTWD